MCYVKYAQSEMFPFLLRALQRALLFCLGLTVELKKKIAVTLRKIMEKYFLIQNSRRFIKNSAK